MKKVIIYSSLYCPWCVKAKEYLKSKGVSFEEKNISLDRSFEKEMIRKSGQRGVPVIEIDGSIVIGFNKDEMEKLLKK